MAVIRLPFTVDSSLAVEVPEERLAWVADYGRAKRPFSTDEETIREALAHPIGAPPLRELAGPDKTVAVMVDDVTRPTPVPLLLPHVLRELSAAGVSPSNVRVVIAVGTHRVLTDAEIRQRCGLLSPKVEVLCIHHTQLDKFVDIGQGVGGEPIVVLKAVFEADLKIGIGNIVPHMYAGWGGGAKIIQPGVCAQVTTEFTHTLGVLNDSVLNLCTNPENIVRREMESIAAAVGLDFIVNTVLDQDKGIVNVFAGHYIEAHRAGVALAEQIYRPTIPELADVVVTTAYPSHLDYRQGIKALIHAQYGVRPGGVVILAMAAPEGLAGGDEAHSEAISVWGPQSEQTIRQAILERKPSDLIAAAFALCHRQMLDRARVICLSEGIDQDTLSRLGFVPTASIGSALERAEEMVGREARIGVVTSAGCVVRCQQEMRQNGGGH
ncbi:MAG: nickel-dependent lactate racemase [Bacillota bacterium]|nr:nickel-dependent lactate racemase [Bacillota bacterium]